MMNQTPELKPVVNRQEFNLWQALGTMVSTAIIVATLFNLITPSSFFTSNLQYSLNQAIRNQTYPQREATRTPDLKDRIGIVAGHWGDGTGFTCADSTTESDINLTIATLVRQRLLEAGYEVDILKEFDSRLSQYNGLLLLSIHSGSCEYIDNSATGFKVAPSLAARANPDQSMKLAQCVAGRYAAATGLRLVNGSSDDMTTYHGYDEIDLNTPSIILEAGFLNLDRELLTRSTEVVAEGIVDGILCYIKNEDPGGGVSP